MDRADNLLAGVDPNPRAGALEGGEIGATRWLSKEEYLLPSLMT